jgi:apolipoprotein N-acyltransferase
MVIATTIDRKAEGVFRWALPGALGIFLVGMGRASSWAFLAPIAAFCGYACMFIAMSSAPEKKQRRLRGVLLYSSAMLIQSSWLLSHPYGYIWAVWIGLSLLMSIPYTLVSDDIVRHQPHTLASSAGAAAALALIEYGLQSLPCGYSFQSAALHLSWCLLPLQLASLCGAIGLSFFVFWANILVYAWLRHKGRSLESKPGLGAKALLIIMVPYIVGGALYWYRAWDARVFDTVHPPLSVAFCHMEEPPDVYSRGLSPERLHEQEWQKLLRMASSVPKGKADFIVFPEGAAPYPAEAPLFSSLHLPSRWATASRHQRWLSSIDLAFQIAISLQTQVLIGLEGRDIRSNGTVASYNSCFCLAPDGRTFQRYDKQLLLPLGEYIPCEWLRSALAAYGIHDSFTAGSACTVFSSAEPSSLRICPLICYEETFPSYTRAAACLRPNVLVSLSNDCWYPAVRHEHFELARLRAVEAGLPLVRSCNQGTSAAVDALGRTVARQEGENSCVMTKLSAYTSPSFFVLVGQGAIASGFCLLSLLTLVHRRSLAKTARDRGDDASSEAREQ